MRGKGLNECALNEKGKKIIICSKKYYRPTEVETLLGNSNKAKKLLKWKSKTNIDELIDDMINFEMSHLRMFSVVITTISKPNKCLKSIAKNIGKNNKLIIIGDKKSPKKFKLKNSDYFPISHQIILVLKLINCLVIIIILEKILVI